MLPPKYASYRISVKALLYKDDKILVLYTPDGYVDFPGGRVDESEIDIPWTEVLRRELAEEVSESIEVEIGKTLFVSKRRYNREGVVHDVAAIYFECKLVGGDVTLSHEHGDHKWLTPAEILADDHKFISEDEKQQLKNLFG